MIRDRIRAARKRFAAELRARGAARDLGVVGSLRKVGVGGLIRGGLLGAIDLVSGEVPPAPGQPARAEKTVLDAQGDPIAQEGPGAFLWLDRDDAGARIAQRLTEGKIDETEAALLRHWTAHGYAVMPGAIDHALIDEALADIDGLWQRREHVSIDLLTNGQRTFIDKIDGSHRLAPHKLNNVYLSSSAAMRIFMHPKIVRFAEMVFDNCAVGCNSLTFEYGSQQPAHIDHVYMTPERPRRLVASWIALEDVRPEAGPLQLWSGSHKAAPYSFEGSYHFRRELEQKHGEYVDRQKQRYEQSSFMAKKGDVLLWHGLFIHGGSPILDPKTTRRSMACHYFSGECPGDRSRLVPVGDHFVLRVTADQL
jgi:phytanoyl-CoA hydroxylase